jgi:protein-S-isoprenylcysteine O-methyltransferase Ste14
MNIQIIIYAAVLFFISEMLLFISKRSKNKTLKTGNDKMSLLFIWLSITFNMTFGFFLANYQPWDSSNKTIAYIALILFCFGIILRWFSILQLKKEFTVDVAIHKDHQLKTDGLYKYIRHPSYSGLLIICLGLSLGMNSLLSVLAALPVVIAVLYRIKVEEAILIEEFGEVYQDYMKNTGKLVPKLF